jgi:hypothetical protein
MKRRDFSTGLLLAGCTRSARAQEPAKQHRIAIITPAGSATRISDTSPYAFFKEFFKELRRLGDVEGQNLTVERSSSEGRPERYADLAREVVNQSPTWSLPLPLLLLGRSAPPATRYRSCSPAAIRSERDW